MRKWNRENLNDMCTNDFTNIDNVVRDDLLKRFYIFNVR